MAHWASKYGIYVLSTANYEDGVAHSSLMEDFPMVLAAATFYDHKSGFQKFDGRHPVTGIPLIVTEYDRHETAISQHGVAATGSGVAAPYGDPITIVSLVADVTNAAIMNSIDGDPNHIIYGVWNVVGEPDDLIPALEDYYIDSVIPQSRWDVLEPFMVARGVEQSNIDTWRGNNPNATPNDVKRRFESFVS